MNWKMFLASGSFALLLATAGEAKSCQDATACAVAEFQATRQPFRGPKSEKRVDACVRLLSTDLRAPMTEVVLVAGDDPLRGKVLTSLGRGNGHSFKLPNQPEGAKDVYVREFCFSKKLIMPYDTITFCNGLTPGDGNHHTLSFHDDSAPYLRRLKETGHAGDFLTLLGTKRSYNAPVSTFFTQGLYQRLYGTSGGWKGS